MTDPALEVRGLRASHPGAVVLHDVDLTVAPGSLTAVLGPSGCGKTTLLRVVAGFHGPDDGSVRLGGRPVAGSGVTTVPPEQRRIGLVPQDGALFEHLTVAGNVGFGLRSLDRAARRERVAAMLDLVGLAELAARRPRELSGGQQQRVALARALAPQPRLVLLDEPFSALDASLRQELREEVRRVLRAAGAAAVLVTHDRSEALGLADRLVVLRTGRVVADDDPRTVYRDPPDADVALLVGEGVLLAALRRGDHADTDLGRLAVRGPGEGGGHVVVRPEELVLVDDPAAVRLPVREVLFAGATSTVVLGLPDGGSVRLTTGGPAPDPGAVVGVAVTAPVRWLPAPEPSRAEPVPAGG
ncbi:ABC transporter ATP-binding protein [Actinomycetospora soli]|uniref:ABC transporter ATP-binding protein n=1 Tax=Actinomycetospora soli TaxID=2893887 RepID=UPI001E358D0C|nr:ABC transporter ATP-binding protein [Actinomycetospora soli]MCD2185819.1 ABC transporter ATP-binding protein [Actinomycetospora soli]